MNYQKLFNYMSKEHGVALLEQEMQEICNIVNEMQSDELRQPLVSGQVCPVCGKIGKIVNGRSECYYCGSITYQTYR